MSSDPFPDSSAHSVLVIPVPELNDWVRARTAYYDASFLGHEATFVNAHITLLGPWLTTPTPRDLARVAEIAARTPAFDYVLTDLCTFPDGIAYLDPEPAAPFTALTDHLIATFPQCPPYGGAFGTVVPHLTVDQVRDEVTLESVRASLGGLIPTRSRATRIDLQWWENDNCHVMGSWELGG